MISRQLVLLSASEFTLFQIDTITNIFTTQVLASYPEDDKFKINIRIGWGVILCSTCIHLFFSYLKKKNKKHLSVSIHFVFSFFFFNHVSEGLSASVSEGVSVKSTLGNHAQVVFSILCRVGHLLPSLSDDKTGATAISVLSSQDDTASP